MRLPRGVFSREAFTLEGHVATAPQQFPMRQHHNLCSELRSSFPPSYRVVVLAFAIGRLLYLAVSRFCAALCSRPFQAWQRIISTSMSRVRSRDLRSFDFASVSLRRAISSNFLRDRNVSRYLPTLVISLEPLRFRKFETDTCRWYLPCGKVC